MHLFDNSLCYAACVGSHRRLFLLLLTATHAVCYDFNRYSKGVIFVKRLCCVLLAMLLFVGLLAGCGGSDVGPENLTGQFAKSEYDAVGDTFDAESSDESIIPENDAGVNEESTDNQAISRKLVRTFDINGEVQDFDGFMAWIEKAVGDAGGYMQESSNDRQNEHKYFNGVIRIPDSGADAFIDGVAGIVNVRTQSVTTDDITLKYSDTKASVESLRIEQQTLQDMLAKAEAVSDIIQIQDRLSYVRQSIESYESALKLMDNQVDYATINLYVSEVATYTEPIPDTWWGRATKGFVSNCEGVIHFFQELGLFVFVNIPWFVILGCVVVIILLATRKARLRNKAIREQNKQAIAAMQAAQQVSNSEQNK